MEGTVLILTTGTGQVLLTCDDYNVIPAIYHNESLSETDLRIYSF